MLFGMFRCTSNRVTDEITHTCATGRVRRLSGADDRALNAMLIRTVRYLDNYSTVANMPWARDLSGPDPNPTRPSTGIVHRSSPQDVKV